MRLSSTLNEIANLVDNPCALVALRGLFPDVAEYIESYIEEIGHA